MTTVFQTLLQIVFNSFMVKIVGKSSSGIQYHYFDLRKVESRAGNFFRCSNEGINIPLSGLGFIVNTIRDIKREMTKKNFLLRTSKDKSETLKSRKSNDCVTSHLTIEIHAPSPTLQSKAFIRFIQSYPNTHPNYPRENRSVEIPLVKTWENFQRAIKQFVEFQADNSLE